MNWQETCRYFPEGVQTLSKRPCVHVEGVYPNTLVRGKGSHVWDDQGREFIDFPCSLGTNLLGHAYPAVVEAVEKQVESGTLFSLSHPKETLLAELLHETIPSMESMRFVKTGSEACNAAVRIARAYTKRFTVLVCGYHGWHDFYNCTTPKNAGVCAQPVISIEWGNVKLLEELMVEKEPAALMIEPYVLQNDEKQIQKWLQECRRLCTVHKSILIFDENVTGFRTLKLSAQEYWKVRPDLTCIGKAMANGVPMACVGGKREIMDVLKGDCFVSSTFGGDLLGISAAIATIMELRTKPIVQHIWAMGTKLKVAFNQAAEAICQPEVRCLGMAPRTHFLFPTAAHKSLFWQECLKQGILFGHAQFVSWSHSQIDIEKASMVMRHAMQICHKHWDNPLAALEGKPAGETLRMVQVPAKGAEPIPEEKVPEDQPEPTKPKEKPVCKKCGRKHWPMHRCKT